MDRGLSTIFISVEAIQDSTGIQEASDTIGLMRTIGKRITHYLSLKNIENDSVSRKPTSSIPEHYILDNIMGFEELLWIYHFLLESPSWTLARTSVNQNRNMLPFAGFPGLHIETNGEMGCEFLAGYFKAIAFRVASTLKNEYGFSLPLTIKRIHVGAKTSFSKTAYHIDSRSKADWTILGFLSPVWDTGDGGEFFLESRKIEYKSGRFIVFPSSTYHDGGYVVNEKLSYWRVAVNIILSDDHSDDRSEMN